MNNCKSHETRELKTSQKNPITILVFHLSIFAAFMYVCQTSYSSVAKPTTSILETIALFLSPFQRLLEQSDSTQVIMSKAIIIMICVAMALSTKSSWTAAKNNINGNATKTIFAIASAIGLATIIMMLISIIL
ncbi:hypothetical protein I3271_09240 [Photobacterium leiognathi]|uniref:hypothetical protein n=1 Tax=Photobacterium leiognathi TaxID=553611 RepID=UPI001EDE013D|nr:hypothetical protein [Photobacterium leiognathi]MCG3884872.1 hypothetical protein [Photobacterium leiognathi]